jgi:hypothetical protein
MAEVYVSSNSYDKRTNSMLTRFKIFELVAPKDTVGHYEAK